MTNVALWCHLGCGVQKYVTWVGWLGEGNTKLESLGNTKIVFSVGVRNKAVMTGIETNKIS